MIPGGRFAGECDDCWSLAQALWTGMPQVESLSMDCDDPECSNYQRIHGAPNTHTTGDES